MNLCAECKGKGLCGRPQCPVISRFRASITMKPADSYMGGAPSIFVGSHGYPRVRGGPLLIGESDSPPEWIRRKYSIDDIVGVRARTIRGTSPIRDLTGPMQEIALSERPLEVEVAFERPVRFDLAFDGTLAPVGLSGTVRKVDVLENPAIARPVDRITADTDLKAAEAVGLLYRDGIDVYRINQLLSAGLLGVKRRAVPTRWAITAVDDMIAAGMKTAVLRHPVLDAPRVFFAELHANRIAVMLVPGPWQFEMIEIWEKSSLWSQNTTTILRDGEGAKPKSGHSPLAGAYYSARLAVLEYLDRLKRSARVIVVRRILPDYWAPLGTWVIREATAAAMAASPATCEDPGAAAAYLSHIIGTDEWLEKSTLIREIKVQKSLFDF